MKPDDMTRAQIKAQLERDVAQFLANGGTILRVDHTANAEYRRPLKVRRRELIAEQKRTVKIGANPGGTRHRR